MGPGRPHRTKPIVLSSDDEDDSLPVPRADIEETTIQEEPVETNSGRASRSKSTAPAATNSKVAKSPSKPRQSRQSTKSVAEAQPKRANKSIFSFFNATTQRQQASSQDSASPAASVNPVPKEEDIEDDISADDATASLSQPSRITQTLRKRKLNEDNAGDTNGDAPPAASQKFRKVSGGSRIPTAAPSIATDTRPWTERFAPVDVSELAVHKRKIADVRSLLEFALSQRARPRLIVLKGAAGTGKTTTVKLLAKEMGIQIMEWKSPVGTDTSSSAFTSYSSQFEDFVFRSGKFDGLDLIRSDGTARKAEAVKQEHGKQIMLIEEFPNTFARTSPALQTFRNTILQYLATPSSNPTPMVMVVSEALFSTTTASADSFTAHRLLGPAILNHPQTAPIEFNHIAPTYLVKALDAIVIKESRKSGRRFAPGPAVLKHLAETGDIRSAVSSLEFLCLAGDDSDAWSTRVAFTKPRGRATEPSLTKKEQEALKLISNRESSLGIFHAVGRVVYNKRIDPSSPVPQPPTHFPQHRKPKLPEHDPNNLIDEVGTDTSTFVGALQENYVLSCASTSSEDAMDSLNGCIDALSDFDMLSCDRFGFGTRTSSGSAQDNLRQDDISFQTAIRGILFWLPNPVNRLAGLGRSAKRGDEFKMFFPSSSKLWKEKEEFEDTLENVISTMHTLAVGSASESAAADKEGVAAWKRHQTSFTPSEDNNDDTGTTAPLSNSLLSSTARTETLLERLPYAAQIFPRQQNIPQGLISSIGILTRISTLNSGSTALDDAAPDAGDDYELDPQQSEWTDRPDPESPATKRGKGRRKDKVETEGGGLQIPVEHAVEKLVLSDDDIEDD